MGIQKEAKNKVSELLTGVHLVMVHDAILVKDKDGVPIQNGNEMNLRVRFIDNDKKQIDHDFWLGGDREVYFDSFCTAANIDKTNPKFKTESKGRRVWACIKELWKVDGTETVLDPFTEEPDKSYHIFKFLPFEDSGKKPEVAGDPALHPKGIATDPFVDYIDISGGKAEAPKVKEKEDEVNWDDF